MDSIKSLKIDVTPIQYVKAVNLIRNSVKNIYLMYCSWCYMNKFRYSGSQIKLYVKLYAGFC
jgi:hypothetical protein